MIKASRQFQWGISMVEIMFTLAVVAIIIAASTYYFANAREQSRVASVISQTQNIISKSMDFNQHYAFTDMAQLIGNGPSPGGSATKTTDGMLIDNNMLPKSILINPWGGNTTATLNDPKNAYVNTNFCYTSTNTLFIAYEDIPQGSCKRLAKALNEFLPGEIYSHKTVSCTPSANDIANLNVTLPLNLPIDGTIPNQCNMSPYFGYVCCNWHNGTSHVCTCPPTTTDYSHQMCNYANNYCGCGENTVINGQSYNVYESGNGNFVIQPGQTCASSCLNTRVCQ